MYGEGVEECAPSAVQSFLLAPLYSYVRVRACVRAKIVIVLKQVKTPKIINII